MILEMTENEKLVRLPAYVDLTELQNLVKIPINSNIVFSAILNSLAKIGQLIINGSRFFKFFTIVLL
jgi:hypothetical protein